MSHNPNSKGKIVSRHKPANADCHLNFASHYTDPSLCVPSKCFCTCTTPAKEASATRTCLSLSCPERTGGECTSGEGKHHAEIKFNYTAKSAMPDVFPLTPSKKASAIFGAHRCQSSAPKESKCCDKCHDVYFDKTYPAHTAYDACIDPACPCHKKTKHTCCTQYFDKGAETACCGGCCQCTGEKCVFAPKHESPEKKLLDTNMNAAMDNVALSSHTPLYDKSAGFYTHYTSPYNPVCKQAKQAKQATIAAIREGVKKEFVVRQQNGICLQYHELGNCNSCAGLKVLALLDQLSKE